MILVSAGAPPKICCPSVLIGNAPKSCSQYYSTPAYVLKHLNHAGHVDCYEAWVAFYKLEEVPKGE